MVSSTHIGNISALLFKSSPFSSRIAKFVNFVKCVKFCKKKQSFDNCSPKCGPNLSICITFGIFFTSIGKSWDVFCEKNEFGAVQMCVNRLDNLYRKINTSINLQKSASIQPTKRHPKFGTRAFLVIAIMPGFLS